MCFSESFYDKTVVLILSYNSMKLTEKCISYLQKEYSDCLDIVVVDNNSHEKLCLERMKIISRRNVHIVYSKSNLGYARGNNLGVRWINKKLPLKEYIVIMNPDIEVFDDTLFSLYRVLKQYDDIAVVSSRILYNGEDRGMQDFGWKFPNMKTLFFSETLIGRLLKIEANDQYKKIRGNKGIQKVDVVPGCFFMTRKEDFIKAGLFDHRTFLFYEENILGARMKKNKKKEAILLQKFVNHNHLKRDEEEKRLEDHFHKRVNAIKSKCIYALIYSKKTILEKMMIISVAIIDIIIRTILYEFHVDPRENSSLKV